MNFRKMHEFEEQFVQLKKLQLDYYRIVYYYVVSVFCVPLQKIYDDIQLRHGTQADELTKRADELGNLTLSLQSVQDSLKKIKNDTKEQEYLVSNYAATEKVLHGQAGTLLNVVDEALKDAQKLHDKIDNKT